MDCLENPRIGPWFVKGFRPSFMTDEITGDSYFGSMRVIMPSYIGDTFFS